MENASSSTVPAPPFSRPTPRVNACASHIALREIDLAFGDRVVLSRVSCSFPPGKISVVLGGSGVGKSTLLRLIGGLIKPLHGTIEVCGEDITRLSERALYGIRSRVGMMFQNGALLDSMSVFDNLAFPLREHSKLGEEEIGARVMERLGSVGLPDVADLLPGQLSGGMVKRVALARAVILRPEILLCDEPFSGLDPISAKRIEALLRRFNRELGVTIVAVSHDVASTLRMADHVVILLPDGAFEGTVDELRGISDPRLRSFLSLEMDEEAADEDHAIEGVSGFHAPHGQRTSGRRRRRPGSGQRTDGLSRSKD